MSETDTTGHPWDGVRVRLRCDGAVVAGVRRVGPLRRTTDVISHHQGGDAGPAQKIPGRTAVDAVVVELDAVHDPVVALWAGATGDGAAPAQRLSLRVEVLDDAGEVAVAYDLTRCWVSLYQALPDLDAGPGAVTASVRLECERWARDPAVPAPPPPVDG